MSDPTLRRVVLASETDLDGFRHAARRLVAQAVAPQQVTWSTARDNGELDWSDPPAGAKEPLAPRIDRDEAAPPLLAPAAFVELCRSAVLHRDPQRFGLLYRLLWRLQHEPGLRHDALDVDWVAVRALAQAVRRDLHKMKAFVRFREWHGGSADDASPENGNPPGSPLSHIAWFEPEHHIVEAVAPFFASRFASLRWAILTPGLSVRWDGKALHFGPGARREDAPPADAGERLWLTYYEHIFNPARLKLAAMQKEMPRRYWHNLPEARLIQPLAAAAASRSGAMLARPAAQPARRVPPSASSRVTPAPASAEGQPTAAAEGLRTLAELREATDRCRECPIGEHATQSVFGEGPVGARLMLVGEQPGDQEDLGGRPFIGPAGRLLDRALADLGWSREQLYVTNAVKHFKFELRGKRRMHKTPGQREVAACNHWLQAEIERVRPQAVVALGATAARALLGRAVAVMSERGHWLPREDGLPVLVTLHPSALLRGDPADRENAYALWLDDLGQATKTADGH